MNNILKNILSVTALAVLIALPGENQANSFFKQRFINTLSLVNKKHVGIGCAVTTALCYYGLYHRPYQKALTAHQLDLGKKNYALKRLDKLAAENLHERLSELLRNFKDNKTSDRVRMATVWRDIMERYPQAQSRFQIRATHAQEVLQLFKEDLQREEERHQAFIEQRITPEERPLKDIWQKRFDIFEQFLKYHQACRRELVAEKQIAERAIPLSPWQKLKEKMFPRPQAVPGPVARG